MAFHKIQSHFASSGRILPRAMLLSLINLSVWPTSQCRTVNFDTWGTIGHREGLNISSCGRNQPTRISSLFPSYVIQYCVIVFSRREILFLYLPRMYYTANKIKGNCWMEWLWYELRIICNWTLIGEIWHKSGRRPALLCPNRRPDWAAHHYRGERRKRWIDDEFVGGSLPLGPQLCEPGTFTIKFTNFYINFHKVFN